LVISVLGKLGAPCEVSEGEAMVVEVKLCETDVSSKDRACS
jgi:hypothetical protein